MPFQPQAEPLDFSDDYANRLERCYAGAVYDVLRGMGRPDQILPRSIRPLDPMRALAGKIFTISGHADFTVDGHTTLLEWTRMLSKAPGAWQQLKVTLDDNYPAHCSTRQMESMILFQHNR